MKARNHDAVRHYAAVLADRVCRSIEKQKSTPKTRQAILDRVVEELALRWLRNNHPRMNRVVKPVKGIAQNGIKRQKLAANTKQELRMFAERDARMSKRVRV